MEDDLRLASVVPGGGVRTRFPRVALDPDVLLIDDEDVLTSAGAAAGIDPGLLLIRKDHCREVANEVARMRVVPGLRPPSGWSQTGC